MYEIFSGSSWLISVYFGSSRFILDHLGLSWLISGSLCFLAVSLLGLIHLVRHLLGLVHQGFAQRLSSLPTLRGQLPFKLAKFFPAPKGGHRHTNRSNDGFWSQLG